MVPRKPVLDASARYKLAHPEWYREYHRRYQAEHQPAARASVRKIVRKLKDVPCADCGRRFLWYVMDFDHGRHKKHNNIGSMGNSLTPTAILKEAKKCDVVCACCHRIRTYMTKKEYRTWLSAH